MRAHGVRTVIDLRGDDEVAEAPSPYQEGMAYRRVPFTSARMMALHRAAHDGTLPDELRRTAVLGGGLASAIAAIASARPPPGTAMRRSSSGSVPSCAARCSAMIRAEVNGTRRYAIPSW